MFRLRLANPLLCAGNSPKDPILFCRAFRRAEETTEGDRARFSLRPSPQHANYQTSVFAILERSKPDLLYSPPRLVEPRSFHVLHSEIRSSRDDEVSRKHASSFKSRGPVISTNTTPT